MYWQNYEPSPITDLSKKLMLYCMLMEGEYLNM
jgi:hypothetical protein